jgi:ubiquinone/menaquinone biosynthesis C-methylase UbiE
MSREIFIPRLRDVFYDDSIAIHDNFVLRADASHHTNQQHTNDAFSEKWQKYEQSSEKERGFQFQRDWYLQLYGFDTEMALASFLGSKNVIFDAGCGLGYKAAWFAELAPHALVIGMDFSNAAGQAAQTYRELENLFFIQGDIAHTGLREGSVDYTSCDQVIMHTEHPALTFAELARVTARDDGEFACYFYAKKALPRELLDDYFRTQCMNMERQELWAMSEQLTELGKRLSALNVVFDCPDIPALDIKGGRYDVQRFIYWNFLKCFWNAQLGKETSVMTNFDWYSPSNARRFSEHEVREIITANNMAEMFFHAEEACYSGRFAHQTTKP